MYILTMYLWKTLITIHCCTHVGVAGCGIPLGLRADDLGVRPRKTMAKRARDLNLVWRVYSCLLRGMIQVSIIWWLPEI